MYLIASYLYLRRAIGIVGILIPIAIPLGFAVSNGQYRILPSISSYYYTDVRNIFVGSMCSIGIFLFCYRLSVLDDILTTIAGSVAILVALCPTTPPNPSSIATVVGYLHIAFAAILLVGFALISWFVFTQRDSARPDAVPENSPASRKHTRNGIYRGCAIVIVVFVILAAASSKLPDSFVHTYHPLFWCEAIATEAFGVSWLIKGQTLFRDRPERSAASAAPGAAPAASASALPSDQDPVTP